MFQHVVVPIDFSAASWRAVPVAARLAAAVGGTVEVVTVVDRVGLVGGAEHDLVRGLDRVGDLPVPVRSQVLAGDTVAAALASHVESTDGRILVMSSHGRGRTAAVLGSVVDDVLRLTFGPVVVVGPHVADDAGRADGDYVIAVDGSQAAENILPIVGAWAIEFGGVPWVVEVGQGDTAGSACESGYPARLARRLSSTMGREAQFEVLHGDDPAERLVDHARVNEASMIFATTHGRTGMARFRLGSVAAEIVKHATCPVVLYRPPHLAEERRSA